MSMLAGLTKVDEVPKVTRQRADGKYDEVVAHISSDENTGQWFEIPATYRNAQIATRLNKEYGDQGIKAVARKTGTEAVEVDGEVVEKAIYSVFIAHNPVDED